MKQHSESMMMAMMVQLTQQADLHGTAQFIASQHPSEVTEWAVPRRYECMTRAWHRGSTVLHGDDTRAMSIFSSKTLNIFW